MNGRIIATVLALVLAACGGASQSGGPEHARTSTSEPGADDTSNWTPEPTPSDHRGTVTVPPGGWTYTEHLPWAKRMVDEVTKDFNVYGNNPSALTWKDVDDATTTSNRSVCASFVYTLLMKTYGYTTNDFKTWFGSTGPTPTHFSSAIDTQKGFKKLTKIDELQAGDIISIVYPPNATSIGHVVIVADAPTLRDPQKDPLIADTSQYVVWIYDSTSSVHWTNDSRSATSMTGAGKGTMRIYVDPTTKEWKGHTWSESSASTYYDIATRPISVGRLNGTVMPAG